MKTNTQLKILTHDGAFHPDEVLAVALLIREGFDYSVIRTRDPLLLAQASDEDFIVDIGGEYDGEYKFDHHQAKTNSDECYGISSAGLIAKYLGLDDPKLVEFIKFVDTRDTRVGYKPKENAKHDNACNNIVLLNDIDIYSKRQEQQFENAVLEMDNYISSWSGVSLDNAAGLADACKRLAFAKRKKELCSYVQNKNKIYVGEYVPGHLLPNDWAFFLSYDVGQSAWTVLANTEKGHALAKDQGKFIHVSGFIGKFESINWGIWYDGSDGFKDAVVFREEDSDYRYEIPVGDVYYR